MNSYLPQWAIDLSSLSSILGLIVTIFLLLEARNIRNSFLRRARLPEVVNELNEASSKLSKCLKSWNTENRSGMEQISIIKGLLENLQPKLPEAEKKKVVIFVRSLKTREWFFIESTITNASEDEAWKIYTEFVSLLTILDQLQKDSRWN